MKEPLQINRDLMRTYAPPMPGDFCDRMGRVMDTLPRKGEKPMRKKLSFGLALALMLALLALGVLAAALLTPQEAVEQQLLPMALESDSELFTQEEIDAILRLAEENGIALPDYIYRYLSQGDRYKEEVIMAFAKSQFGPYPGQWTLEQQCWFEEVMVAISFKDYNAIRVPGEGDLPYEEAYALAKAAIAREGWLTDTAILDDREQYDLWRSYRADRDEATGAILEPVWYFHFEANELRLAAYHVTMDKAGQVTDITVEQGLEDVMSESGPLTYADLYDRFTEVYGSMPDWTPEIFVDFGTALRQADLDGASATGRAIAQVTYLIPPEDALPMEKALALAVAAVGSEDGYARNAYCMMDGDRAIWKVGVSSDGRVRDMVEMDLYTGEILKAYPAINTDGAGQFYVPQSVWEATPETDTPGGVG